MEIKELSVDEISEQLKKSRIELVNLRMKLASRQLENPSQIKKQRKEIARMLTIQTQKLKNGEAVGVKEVKTKSKSLDDKPMKKEKKLKAVKMTEEKETKKKTVKKKGKENA